jgi:hypothetical protein
LPDIEAFVRRLTAAATRRVTILVSNEPPPNSVRDIFQLVHGVQQAQVPGHRELLPALWEMGLLPDVRILPALPGAGRGALPTREHAIESVANSPIRVGTSPEELRSIVEAHFDDLFLPREGGWALTTTADSRSLLITWEPS